MCGCWLFWQYVYCTLTEVFLTLIEVFLTLTEVFPWFFLSCEANVRVKLAKTGHGPHSSKLVVICVVLLIFVLFYILFLCKCVLYYCHRVTAQLQLTNISNTLYRDATPCSVAKTYRCLCETCCLPNLKTQTEVLQNIDKCLTTVHGTTSQKKLFASA
jgi:magnesium-transporting ATPase (P-type)